MSYCLNVVRLNYLRTNNIERLLHSHSIHDLIEQFRCMIVNVSLFKSATFFLNNFYFSPDSDRNTCRLATSALGKAGMLVLDSSTDRYKLSCAITL